ncbi:Lipoma HMGIC fusion partner-like 3 protein, partial [Gryllus bimaculatus]
EPLAPRRGPLPAAIVVAVPASARHARRRRRGSASAPATLPPGVDHARRRTRAPARRRTPAREVIARVPVTALASTAAATTSAAMGSKVEYVESSHMYATNYVRNSKAIGVLWGVFSICYAIIVAVAFATPEWLGDPAAVASDHSARFGLFARCYYRTGAEGGPDCQGGLDELMSLPTVAWQLAAVLVALAALFALLAVAAMLLFFFLPATAVFRSAAWIQLFSGEVNNGFVGDAHSVAGSRKSLNLHPVLLMPGNEADRFSEFSGRTAGGRSKSSAYRGAEYAPSIQNFQL